MASYINGPTGKLNKSAPVSRPISLAGHRIPPYLTRKSSVLSVRYGPIQERVRSPQHPDSKPWSGYCGLSPPQRGNHKVNARFVDIVSSYQKYLALAAKSVSKTSVILLAKA